ncbi:MAG: F0F1 ATP synthase subunit alpha [Butyrivibrio sp.]|nr:F0F1 ATP synthase subunit alpha [Butyrivibrio sp.]
MDNTMNATLRYAVTAPSPSQLDSIRKLLSDKFEGAAVEIQCVQDPKMGGGFIVTCGNFEYDWSDEGRAKQLRAELNTIKTGLGTTDTSRIISMIRDKVENFELSVKDREVGTVSWVGDGIANVEGIDHAFYGEIIEFEDGTRGMAQDIREDHVGCILFGSDKGIREGSRAVRTYKEAGVPVGEGFIGRVVDALGAPIDGLGDIKESGYRAVEERSPGILERQSVNEPMETGILSIDTMFPIGRGQRELIIGDRQTGKTSIALDTIINQKGKGVICIYVAIGQKASTVSKIIQTLKKNDALKYTTVVCATAADTAPLQYIAPYAGTSMAEYFMYRGKDVLIVYDDLSKHAVAYRALSLLLERPPGREAYPGDVFYLHSRLLERSSKLSSELGGGSITALPIIETQAGDVSAYIPTNVISITDGQIFLESDLFFAGIRPAVNVGLSVSRVGSAAQTKAMKKATGSIRVDLAQYREMAVFTQFSSDLDETTRKQLNHGDILMELLKQPLEHPLAMHEMVIILVAVGAGRIDNTPVGKVQEYKEKLITYFNTEHEDICKEITKGGDLPESLRRQILDAVDKFNSEIEVQ